MNTILLYLMNPINFFEIHEDNFDFEFTISDSIIKLDGKEYVLYSSEDSDISKYNKIKHFLEVLQKTKPHYFDLLKFYCEEEELLSL